MDGGSEQVRLKVFLKDVEWRVTDETSVKS